MSKLIIEDVVFCRWIFSLLGRQKALFTDALQVIELMRFTFLKVITLCNCNSYYYFKF